MGTTQYIPPNTEDLILDVTTKKEDINWREFLVDLIRKEKMDPFDINLELLSQKYLKSLEDLKKIDFNLSGKFLLVAVFLLKEKTNFLIEHDLRKIEDTLSVLEENEVEDLNFENFEETFENIKKEKKEYLLKYKNPISRKRKVTIYDLLNVLENTIKQSNRRRENFFQRKKNIEYEGPKYHLKKLDIKKVIEKLFNQIVEKLSNKKSTLFFHHLLTKKENEQKQKEHTLRKFIPLLHLHNSNKIGVKQENHLGKIKIEKAV